MSLGARMNRITLAIALTLAAPSAAALLTACHSAADAHDRCARCGMKIAPTNLLAAELQGSNAKALHYDSLRCALAARLEGHPRATLRVHEYYEGRLHVVDDTIGFAIGSDVTGPMGSDLVPVATPHQAKFAADHGAKRFVLLREIDTALLAQLP